MGIFDWLKAVAEDADPVRAGYQASWLYIVWNIAFPVCFGLIVSSVFSAIRRALGADVPKEKS